LERLFKNAADSAVTAADMPTAEEYAQRRSQYIRDGGGTPPVGATPIDNVR